MRHLFEEKLSQVNKKKQKKHIQKHDPPQKKGAKQTNKKILLKANKDCLPGNFKSL